MVYRCGTPSYLRVEMRLGGELLCAKAKRNSTRILMVVSAATPEYRTCWTACETWSFEIAPPLSVPTRFWVVKGNQRGGLRRYVDGEAYSESSDASCSLTLREIPCSDIFGETTNILVYRSYICASGLKLGFWCRPRFSLLCAIIAIYLG